MNSQVLGSLTRGRVMELANYELVRYPSGQVVILSDRLRPRDVVGVFTSERDAQNELARLLAGVPQPEARRPAPRSWQEVASALRRLAPGARSGRSKACCPRVRARLSRARVPGWTAREVASIPSKYGDLCSTPLKNGRCGWLAAANRSSVRHRERQATLGVPAAADSDSGDTMPASAEPPGIRASI